MAKPDKGGKDKAPGKETAKGSGATARFFAGLALVALLFYITCGVAVGLAYVRDAVCEMISERIGIKVVAESSQFGLPFAMVLRNVKTDGYESGAAGFMLQKVRIAPGIGRWRISFERGSVRLACNKDGTWEPAGLAELGPVPERDLSQVSKFSAGFCSHATVAASGITLRWMRGDGEIAAAAGVSFAVRPAELPDRPMLYHELRMTSVVGPGGVRAVDLRREWLAGEGMPYREVVREGGEAKGKGVFWEGTKP